MYFKEKEMKLEREIDLMRKNHDKAWRVYIIERYNIKVKTIGLTWTNTSSGLNGMRGRQEK